jgi:hypothetical protein
MLNPNYYAVIPAPVLCDPELTPNEKLLFGMISSLSNQEGYCWASNDYLGSFFNAHKKTISVWINNLSKRGHVWTKVDKIGNRKIFIVNTPSMKSWIPLHENMDTPPSNHGHSICIEDNNRDKETTGVVASSPSKVSQEKEGPTFEEWLEINQYTPTTYYAGEDEGEKDGWKHRGRKMPYTEEELRKRYQTQVRGQTSRGEAYRALQEVFKVWNHFEKLCMKELGKKPVADAKSRQIIRFALSKTESGEIYDILDEWFSMALPDEETIQITRALSGNQINAYRARK